MRTYSGACSPFHITIALILPALPTVQGRRVGPDLVPLGTNCMETPVPSCYQLGLHVPEAALCPAHMHMPGRGKASTAVYTVHTRWGSSHPDTFISQAVILAHM